MVGSRLSATLTARPDRLPVPPASLAAAFPTVPDPRRAASGTDPLAAVLVVAVAAILATQHAVLAIAAWGARHHRARLTPLGFPAGRTPCPSTRQRLVRRRHPAAVAVALPAPVAPTVAPDPTAPGRQAVASAGKAQRGRRHYHTGGCPVQALTAFAHDDGGVLAQEPIAHGAPTSAGALTVAPAWLARLDGRGRGVTGAARCCQRHRWQHLLPAGGASRLLVTEPQPTRYQDLARLCDPPGAGRPPARDDRPKARTWQRGPGRPDEVRQVIASTARRGSLA